MELRTKEQQRYKTQDISNETHIEYSKWTDESVVINLESPVAGQNKETFKSFSSYKLSKEFIRALPDFVVKKIARIRQDCLVDYPREIKLLSRNNLYRLRVQELEIEVERLNKLLQEGVKETEEKVRLAVDSAVQSLNVELDSFRENK
jgi:hypothetical protein